MAKRLAWILFGWWVVVNFHPVLGPFDTWGGCSRAAMNVGMAYHTLATCQEYE